MVSVDRQGRRRIRRGERDLDLGVPVSIKSAGRDGHVGGQIDAAQDQVAVVVTGHGLAAGIHAVTRTRTRTIILLGGVFIRERRCHGGRGHVDRRGGDRRSPAFVALVSVTVKVAAGLAVVNVTWTSASPF